MPNNSYPPHHIHAGDVCRVIQLSDLHLPDDTCSAYHQNFIALLNKALTLHPDLLLLTGDLVQDGNRHGLDWLFDKLTQTGVAFICIAGNHDVTHENHTHLPFERRTFSPILPDDRLVACHRLQIWLNNINAWQILLLNSTVGGEIAGKLSPKSLTWLDDTLKTHQSNTLLALHHHPLAVGSLWIDAYHLQNFDEFWATLAPYAHVQGVISGHVHQAHALTAPTPYPCQFLTCPASSRQFLPFADTFTLDDIACGFRYFELTKEKFSTQVYRL